MYNSNIKQIKYSEKESLFLDFLNNVLPTYPFKYDYFKFMIVNCDVDCETLKALLDSFLQDILVFKLEKGSLVIYHNKEKIEIYKYIESLSEDVGKKISLFEGFKILIKDKDYLNEFLAIYNQYSKCDFLYNKLSDLIIKIDDINILNRIKNMLLSKYEGLEIEKLLQMLFDNNLNVSKTASCIYMHRNTINNRLSMLEDDTSLSIQRFIDAFSLFKLLNQI